MSQERTPRPPIPPAPTAGNMDESNAIERAKALSLITAEEDEKRRRAKYGSSGSGASKPALGVTLSDSHSGRAPSPSVSLGHAGRASSPGLAVVPPGRAPSPAFGSLQSGRSQSPSMGTTVSTSIAPIPRPKSSRSSTTEKRGSAMGPPPPVPPRPEPSLTSRTRQVQLTDKVPPPLPSIGPNAKLVSGIEASDRSKRTSPSSNATHPAGLPLSVDTSDRDTPLISLSPPLMSQQAIVDFDIRSLDPLHPSSAESSLVLSQPSSRSNSSTHTGSRTGVNRTSVTTGADALPTQIGPRSSKILSNMKMVENPLYVTGFPGAGASSGAGTSVGLACNSAVVATVSKPGNITMIHNPMYGTAASPASTVSTVSVSSGIHVAAKPEPAKPKSVVPVKETLAIDTGILKPDPAPPAKPASPATVDPSTGAAASQLPSGGTSGPIHQSDDGDLMNFSMGEDELHDYLTLECFDPLFALDPQTSSESDSLQLFPNPKDRFQRKETPNPFPAVNMHSTQTILRRVSGEAGGGVVPSPGPRFKAYDKLDVETLQEEMDNRVNDAMGAQREQSASSPGAGPVELMDPFSFSDLTSALEQKREKHERENVKARQALLRKKDDQKKKEREEEKKEVPPKKRERLLSRRNSYMVKGKEHTYETLQEFHETADEEIRSFCQMVASHDNQVLQMLKQQYSYEDPVLNKGLVISAQVGHPPYRDITVKVVVQAKFAKEPIIFTCDLNASVEHVISHVLLTLTDDLGSASTDDYIVKVHGLSEYFLNDSTLGHYEYVQRCLKLDQDIRLVLVDLRHITKSLMRTAEDDKQPVFVPKPRDYDDSYPKVTRNNLNILTETFYKEVEKLRDHALQAGTCRVHCRSVIQAVKAVCAVLCKIETIDIIKAIQRLQTVTTYEQTLQPASPRDRESFVYVGKDGEEMGNVQDSETKRLSMLDDLHVALEELTQSVKGLIELYCRTFHTDFKFQSATNVVKEEKHLSELKENLIVHMASAHRIPAKMKATFEEFRIICGLFHGGRQLCPEITTQTRPMRSEGFQETLVWDEWIQFESIILANLPREARLCFTLIGIKTVTSGSSGSEQGQRVNTALGWVALQVFNHKFELVQGTQMLGLWPGESANPIGTPQSNTEFPNSILIQVNLPDFDCDVSFPIVPEAGPCLKQDFSCLHPDDQELLQNVLDKDVITRLTPDESELVWEKRHYLYHLPEALPKVLQSAHSWEYSNLQEIYTMIQEWTPLSPVQALELLLPNNVADTHVRSMGVTWIKSMSSDELCDYLPQLVQALKFESYHDSALTRLLLEKSVENCHLAHQLYWILKEVAEDVRYRKRYQLLFGALLSVVGTAMRREFSKQEDLVKMLAAIAQKVKAAKDKDAVLQRELENMWDFLQQDSVRLPLDPSMEVTGVDAKSCSYFTSNAFPLKIVLRNVDPKADSIYTMFKVGDDLRQDMLTMQLIHVMDQLWLRDGLDLKIITFRCQPTGPKKGLVELITESETLRKIQVKFGHGLAGSFKDRPIAEWLQLQNPTELEYQKAVDNFIASCAGYCVATYVLGICDRHNDNIMIKQSGHMFHIDFGKFLGDSQMFGNIKRDRVPFVLTSDMAYVINGGDKPSHKFQQFIDLCCHGFNIIRKHGNLFLTLFSLMSKSGIPGVSEGATKYVQRALLPDHTDAEATAAFTRMVDDSLQSLSTQINFFFHNLAQMKFSGHNEGALLSFIPKTYSIDTDGRIANVEIFGYQKRYNPEKYYIYILKVDRENQKVPSFVFRRYSEFQEFQARLVVMFRLARFPSLSSKVLLGRTHVKTVAEARKAELERFLKQLFTMAPEISDCDLVYTFFHPMLRDEQDIDKTNLQKLKERPAPRPSNRTIQGQVKLSVSFKNDLLTVMVMHAKDLGSGGEAPDPYVKAYLMPDPHKMTKRKTKIAKDTFHPTYNEMLLYRMPLEEVKKRTLQVTVWNYNALEENEFMGAALVKLNALDLDKEVVNWYKLQTLHHLQTA